MRGESKSVGLLCCLLLTSLLLEDVNHRDREAEGESLRRRFPPFDIEAWFNGGCYRGERDRGGGGVTTEENRRELLFVGEVETGCFSAGLVLVVFVE